MELGLLWTLFGLLLPQALGSPYMIPPELDPKIYPDTEPEIEPKIETRAEEYRLPTTVVPTNYELALKLATNAFETNSFEGLVFIAVTLTQSLNEIKLHARALTITNITINTDVTVTHALNTVTDILTLTLSRNLDAGEYVIEIHYFGVLGSDMAGFYKSTYVNEQGQTESLATTQFESTSARRAFPCWDEPGFKATFDVSIVHPADYTAIANTPIRSEVRDEADLIMTTFQTTPRMSTYLNAFVVSKFTCTSGASLHGDLPYRVCSRPATADTRALAVDFGPKTIAVLEDWTGINYSESQIGKMDQAAIPDFSAGAMENWGLVTYRERSLLWDPAESSNSYKQSIVNVISHEFAHMWFGNWVTTKWWNDIFLNEGFATYFQFFATHEIYPTWELDKQFVVSQVQSALRTDSSPNSAALSSDATTPSEISNRFDGISYAKGGSILRMLTHIMGLEQFKLGVRSYLNSHRLSSAVAAELITSLGEYATVPAGTTFDDIMKNWIYEPGYPLVTVRLDGNRVLVSQERYLRSGNSTTTWYVPLSYTVSTDNNKFETTTAREWLSPDQSEHALQVELTNTSWIVLNNQQTGFYRVNYNDQLWDRIVTALHRPNFDGIHVLNRAQIVDDLFNYAQIDLIPFSTVLDRTHFLQNDTEYYTWYAAFNGFSNILDKIGSNTIRNALWRYLLGLMQNLYASVPFDRIDEEDQIYTLKQVSALNWACRLGHADCINKAKEIYGHYKEHDMIPNKNLRSTVYCTALRNSDSIQSDWDFLWGKYETEILSTEQVTIISALGCAKNATILQEYLRRATTENSGIRRQDSSAVFQSVYSNNPEGVRFAFDFIADHYEDVANYYSEGTLASLIRTLANLFTTDEEIEQREIPQMIITECLDLKYIGYSSEKTFRNKIGVGTILAIKSYPLALAHAKLFRADGFKLNKLISSGKLSTTVQAAAQSALTNAKTNVEWVKTFEKHLSDYFDLSGGGSSAVTASFATLTITVILVMYQLF